MDFVVYPPFSSSQEKRISTGAVPPCESSYGLRNRLIASVFALVVGVSVQEPHGKNQSFLVSTRIRNVNSPGTRYDPVKYISTGYGLTSGAARISVSWNSDRKDLVGVRSFLSVVDVLQLERTSASAISLPSRAREERTWVKGW